MTSTNLARPRICFVIPPSPFLLDERVFVSLGVLKVAAAAEQYGYGVEVLDLSGVENYLDVVKQHAEVNKYEKVVHAISATTPQMPATLKIRDVIMEVKGEDRGYSTTMPRVILGGPHVTLVAASKSERGKAELKRLLDNFHVVVAGDGEDAIDLAVQDYAPRFIDADDPKKELFLTNKRLGELPLPARHLVDMDSYHYTIDGVRVFSLIAQLGCPFGCNFCAGRSSPMLRRIRTRPTQLVLDEMKHLYDTYGCRGFMFLDDELNVNPKVLELMEGIHALQQELGVEFRCRGFVKAELFDQAQARAMFRAGFRRLLCGFESGSPRILRNINKKATVHDNTKAMIVAQDAGLEMKALMSVGHPGECDQTIEETKQWLLKVKPADFDVTIITPYPGSPYYDEALRFGDVWRFETNGDVLYSHDVDYTKVADYYKGQIGGYKAYVHTEYLTQEELVEARDRVEKEVRDKLGIPYYQAGTQTRFEASMGALPSFIYRRSNGV